MINKFKICDMIYETQDLVEKFKDLDKSFQLILGKDEQIILVSL